ncbi:MAG: hypothetical protein C3F13_04330 [Anaerolineales bacterium]|nr:hypothetical protein [Anaerolineae bacterium]PWB55513.1 MAG: hypothetical protein C3F13_04330 [Anaerolineales bacterium]
MLRKSIVTVAVLTLAILALSACNLPERQVSPGESLAPSTPAVNQPATLCSNQYFPNTTGTTWTYAGSNTVTGEYIRTDTVSSSSTDAFTVNTTLSSIPYSLTYSCSSAGLTAGDPVSQYAGALLSSPSVPVNVKLTSNSGLTLPANVAPGDTWQQTADFEATSQSLNINGRFVFDYTATGFENITVPFGTFDALRVDTTIRVEVSALHVVAGTYTTTSWLVPGVGTIKSEGTSHVSGIDFSDATQLTSYTPAP